MPNSHWLDDVVRAAREPEPLLVVCRTQATVRAVLRRLAETAPHGRGGWPGLQVSTLSGLVAQVAPGRLAPEPLEDEAFPVAHPWKARLEERPGLRRMLRAHLARLHEAALAGSSLDGLRPEIRALVEAGYGSPDSLDGARAILAAPPPPRCLAVGFGGASLTAVSPLDRALLRALDAVHVEAGAPLASLPAPIPALRLPDTVAEARAVAREALARGPGARILVLVPDEATQERVHAAAQRNGVPVADDGSSPLTRHALVAAVEPLIQTFGSRGAEPVEAVDLLRLLTEAVLARTPAGDVEPVPGVDAPRATTRHVRDLLLACRRAHATTAEWVAAMERLAADAAARVRDLDEEKRSGAAWFLASARVLLSQLRALDLYARGDGRLGDLHAFLSAIGLSDPRGDRLGQAILGALRTEGHRPATPEHYADALSGSVSSGRVDAGIVTLPYSAYDGRDADHLLLTGVHDKGLARVPAADPILTPAELRAAGLAAPGDVARERLSIARWAAARAASTLALVSDTDASGRRVSPPVDLALAVDTRDAERSYGLAFELPESRDRAAFAAGSGASDELARQVDAEWARRGAAFAEAALALKPGDTLADQLPLELSRIPEDLLPWLGAAGPHPANGDGLPPGFTISASRLEAFTHCLYRAFCDSVLRLDVPDEVTEDLDPREVGTAVHAAIQKALEGKKLLVPERKLDDARAAALAELREVTEAAVEAEAAKRPPSSDTKPIRLAREGLSARWMRHWERYVAERIGSVEEANRKVQKKALAEVLEGEAFTAVVEALAGGFTAKAPRDQVSKKLYAILCEERGDADAVLARKGELADAVAEKNQPMVREKLATKRAQAAITRLCKSVAAALQGVGFDPKGDLELVAAEHAFGAMARDDGLKDPPLLLPLGRSEIPVRGRIDAVLRRRGAGGVEGTAYRVTDFKTGAKSATADEITEQLIRPQLPLYALALEAQGPLRRGHEPPARVEHGELDYVRQADRTTADFGAQVLARLRAALGAILDHARDGTWLAAPHPQGCPLLRERGVYCDHPEICRVRSKFEPARGEEAAE
jgi:RecB family exonuclease